MIFRLSLAAALLASPTASSAADPAPIGPAEVVAQAPATDWKAIDDTDLLVMDLAPDTAGKTRRVVIQLMPPPFSQGWIGNIRMLAEMHWWDGTSINRVQDNYVVQWGDAEAEDKAKAKPLPEGLAHPTTADYSANADAIWPTVKAMIQHEGIGTAPPAHPVMTRDAYADATLDWAGWPVGTDGAKMWPAHCYGMVGVGRDMPPDTGSGAELYVVIGTPPRHLDRNIALVGRVIEGIEHLSALPRGTGPLGFYEKSEERTAIRQVRLGSQVPGLPNYQYLSTESASFARYADARANRRDAFFIAPAGGADICNVPAPVRRAP